MCTSNKELVAEHGAELIQIAKDHQVNYLFEASVGGGIPIIRPLNSSLTADVIVEISGILNGTTNYMLTKMSREGLNYDDVLKEAQAKGYAELHPEADVEGWDACRKIAILTSLASGNQVDFKDIYTEGKKQAVLSNCWLSARSRGILIVSWLLRPLSVKRIRSTW